MSSAIAAIHVARRQDTLKNFQTGGLSSPDPDHAVRLSTQFPSSGRKSMCALQSIREHSTQARRRSVVEESVIYSLGEEKLPPSLAKLHGLPSGFWRYQTEVMRWYSSRRTQWIVAIIILANFLGSVIEKQIDPLGVTYAPVWRAQEIIFSIIFLVELLVNLCTHAHVPTARVPHSPRPSQPASLHGRRRALAGRAVGWLTRLRIESRPRRACRQLLVLAVLDGRELDLEPLRRARGLGAHAAMNLRAAAAPVRGAGGRAHAVRLSLIHI